MELCSAIAGGLAEQAGCFIGADAEGAGEHTFGLFDQEP
jgi:hypothetical protein